VILARRGPAQAAFTTPELKEMGELAGADVIVRPEDVELDPASEASLEHDTNARRNVEVLREYATRVPEGKPRRVVFRFAVSPVSILGEEHVTGVEIVRNELVADGDRVNALATGEHETLDAGAVFRSVGYQGVELPGVPFDAKRGTMPNVEGRVVDEDGAVLTGVYAAGWIKRGPSGVIGTNKKDATETVARLLEDARGGKLSRDEGDVLDVLGRHVTYAGWEAIDAVEKSAGEPLGRPRVKLCTWDELLAAARKAAAAAT
jgi:ferredoxin/flavodoxin---NADP+ reductase